MVDLAFSIESVAVEPYAAAPTLAFKLRVATPENRVKIQNVLLQCQLRIEATRRHYAEADHERLGELFGAKHRWSDTLHGMLWAHVSAQAPAFEGESIIDLPVPCSFDFNVAATKYFYGLEGGSVPLSFLFSGTVFYRDEDGRLQMEQIPWSKDAEFDLPVSVWREMMNVHYPDSAWLRIDRATFDALARHKRREGFTNWEQTLQSLLEEKMAEGVS